MKVVATRGDGLFLVETASGKAVMVNMETSIVSPELMLAAFAKFGYWENFSGDPEPILKLAHRNG